MPFHLYLTNNAVRDLEEIHEYIAEQDSPRKADALLAKVEKRLATLADTPNRVSCPKELAQLGIREYRQILFKPYRLIYRVLDENVYVLLIADGRRDMRTLLERRLLAAD